MKTLVREDSASSITRFEDSRCSAKDHRAELAFLPDQMCVWSEVYHLSFDLVITELQVVEPPASIFLCLFPTHKESSKPEESQNDHPSCAWCHKPGASHSPFGFKILLCEACHSEEIRVG